MVIMTVIAQKNGHASAANLRRKASSTTSSDALVVHLLACLREEPTGVGKILRGNDKQFTAHGQFHQKQSLASVQAQNDGIEG
jgi:hypothetical protein